MRALGGVYRCTLITETMFLDNRVEHDHELRLEDPTDGNLCISIVGDPSEFEFPFREGAKYRLTVEEILES